MIFEKLGPYAAAKVTVPNSRIVTIGIASKSRISWSSTGTWLEVITRTGSFATVYNQTGA